MFLTVSTLLASGSSCCVTHLRALGAASGATDWHANIDGMLSSSTLAYDGRRVFVLNRDGTLSAYGASTGTKIWSRQLPGPFSFAVKNGDGSSPAVDSSGVYLSYACHQDYRFNLRGALLWHMDPGCQGLGGSTPVLHGGSVCARGDRDYPLILSQSAGTQAGSFLSDTPPAFGPSMHLL